MTHRDGFGRELAEGDLVFWSTGNGRRTHYAGFGAVHRVVGFTPKKVRVVLECYNKDGRRVEVGEPERRWRCEPTTAYSCDIAKLEAFGQEPQS